MDALHIGMVVGGVLLLLLTALTRSDASAGRWGGSDVTERMVVVGLPGLGGSLLVFGLAPVLPPTVATIGTVLALVLLIGVLLWGPLALPLPARWVPRHLRAARAARLRHEKAQRERRKAARRG